MTPEHMKLFVEQNPELVSRKETSIPGVYILKYKNRVFYRNLWTPELMLMRGTVVDEDYRVLTRPLTKVFNYGENGTRIDRDRMVVASRKVNGFMASVSFFNGEPRVSTTGSMDSDYAKLARKWLEPHFDRMLRFMLLPWESDGITLSFEICDPDDPHIVPEEPGVYLLGGRANAWTPIEFNKAFVHHIAEAIGVFPVEYEFIQFGNLLKKVKTVKHEGFMAYDSSGTTVKLKSPYYLTTKLLGRMTDARLATLLANPEAAKKSIDEEFYGIVDHLHDNLTEFMCLDKQGRIEYVRNFFDAELVT